jgi:hypothetical protein
MHGTLDSLLQEIAYRQRWLPAGTLTSTQSHSQWSCRFAATRAMLSALYVHTWVETAPLQYGLRLQPGIPVRPSESAASSSPSGSSTSETSSRISDFIRMHYDPGTHADIVRLPHGLFCSISMCRHGIQ